MGKMRLTLIVQDSAEKAIEQLTFSHFEKNGAHFCFVCTNILIVLPAVYFIYF